MIFEDSLIRDKNRMVIFGASQKGSCALDLLKSRNIKVDFFCDNDKKKIGEKFNGIPIISVDELKKLSNNLTILIASMYYKNIYIQLNIMGFDTIYNYNENVILGRATM